MGSDTWKFWYARKKGTVEPEAPKLGELLGENRNARMLDFGCGAGRHTVYFAKRGFEVYGFDASEIAIKRARKALKKEKLSADLRVWDMTKPLPYEDRFFDALMATRVMHHTYMDTIKRMAKEINRVLKERGFMFLQVPAFSEKAAMKWKEKGFKSEEPEPRTYIYSEGEERGVPHHHFTKEELLGLFENYDVEELHCETEHYGGYCLIARKMSQ
jgi:ubiquinone/menaquinone biosynthesis C-methylase UbiE